MAENKASLRPWDLRGNLALIRNGEIKTIDARGLAKAGTAMAVATAVPELELVAPIPTSSTQTRSTTPTPSSKVGYVETATPIWLAPLVVVTTLAVLIILAVAIWQSQRQKGW